MLLTACTALCTQLEDTFGAQTIQIATTIGAFVLVWLNSKKKIAASDAKAAAAALSAQAAHLSIARLEGSLRPAAYVGAPSLVPLSSSASQTNLEPVVMPELHPSTPTPDSARFPAPPRMPSEAGTRIASEDEIETTPATPSAKKGGKS